MASYKFILIFYVLMDVVVCVSASKEEEDMSWEEFKCYFKCLGGPTMVGLGGVTALLALVYVALPAMGFTAGGILAGSIAAKLMAWYNGTVAAGSLFAILQSVAAAGIGWKAILIALFGPASVVGAFQNCTCR